MKVWAEKGAGFSKRAVAKLKNIEHSSVKRILVIRHAALGDMLQTRPFLSECRKFFPGAKIVLAVISNYQLGAPEDLVDEMIVIPGRDQKEIGIFHLLKIYRNMGKFDLLFDMACTSRSLVQTFFTSARFKMGFPYKHRYFLFDVEIFRSEFVYEAELLLHFLNFMGHVCTYPVSFHLNYKKERERTIGYFLSSSNPLRNYPEKNFLELIDKMAREKSGHQHVIIQGHAAHERYENVFNELKEVRGLKNVVLRKSTHLKELELFLTQICYLVSNDTGVRHLAMALNTPGMGLFSITIPYRNWNPHDNLQTCYFNADGSWPTSDLVFDHLTDHWRRIGL
jgi:ADP-heptose:LPS heptosyltransferase